MRSPLQTAFAAVFQTEVRLNSKRIAPYALMILFTAHAVLWWGWSAAASFGWATNGDFNIVRNLQGFSFLLGLPIFTAVIMADPVIRDFRTGVDSLIFSKPISRGAYLLGKFCGNFFVLVCCQSAFALTMLALQWVPKNGLLVLPARVFPYFKHFFVIVVISHLLLGAIYFTLGTLTRNAKIVYAAAVGFYPLYFAYVIVFLKQLPRGWAEALDPMLTGFQSIPRDKWEDANWINQIVITYSPGILANRGLMALIAGGFLAILYFRFSIIARTDHLGSLSILSLSTAAERIHYDSETFNTTALNEPEQFKPGSKRGLSIPLPEVARTNDGVEANARKLIAAVGLELRLLRTEKSLVVVIPLTLLLAFLSLPFSASVSEVSYSASFASQTANGSLLFLLGVIVFYTGEAMHRDREVRIEPVLWSVPAPNNVLLLSKFMSTLLLSVFLLGLIGAMAMLTQLVRGQAPVEISTYLITYSVILVPSLIFMTAASIALNVLLRDKYLAYTVSIAGSSGLFYLYSRGYNHWLYNPAVYGLWKESDLTLAGGGLSRLLLLRVYCLAITSVCILIAHFRFERRS